MSPGPKLRSETPPKNNNIEKMPRRAPIMKACMLVAEDEEKASDISGVCINRSS